MRHGSNSAYRLDRITSDPLICLGQPTIRGMRITVSVILKMLAAGHTIQEVLAAYPELEADDVTQAVQYHRDGNRVTPNDAATRRRTTE